MEIEVEFYGMIVEKMGFFKTSVHIDFKNEEINAREMIKSLFPELSSMTFQIAIGNELRENLNKDDLGKTIGILPPFAGG